MGIIQNADKLNAQRLDDWCRLLSKQLTI